MCSPSQGYYLSQKTDVHTAHCCINHGCKYGEDSTCTVVRAKLKQQYLCEDCTHPDSEQENESLFKLKQVLRGN